IAPLNAHFGTELFHLLLQFAQAVDHVRQLLHRDYLPLGLFVRRGRITDQCPSLGNIAHHTGLRANHGLIAECQMSRNPRLRSNHAVISKARAAGKTRLAHDQTVPANDDVVRDVHKIINFGALADDSGTKRAAVNGRVGADLHVIVDDHIAALQPFAGAALVEHVTVAVRADDRAGVDADPMTDLRPRINDDVWEQTHVVANLTVPADMVAAHEDGTRAEPHPRAQHAIRADARRGID